MPPHDDSFRLDPDGFDPADWRRSTRALQRIAESVVGDTARAEDIVQGAWVRALERDDRAPRRGWLSRLVRHRSIDARRRDRGRPAHDAPLDSVAGAAANANEVAGRIETQRILLDAVEALDAPYRVTIYLRFFEGLSVREVAARLGVPTRTVETRQTRALARLRERLAPRFRDRRGRWAPALVAFGDPTSLLPKAAAATTSAASGALALTASVTMKKFALTLVAAALLVSGWFAIDALRATSGEVAPSTVGPVQDDAAVDPELASVEAAERGDRATVETVEAATEPDAPVERATPLLDESGALRVTVYWSDGDPAAGVGVVAVTPWGPTGVRRRARRVTNGLGVALFEALPSEEYELRTERTTSDGGAKVEVVTGETVDAAIELDVGLLVEGRVTDTEGRPIQDAEIWLATASGGWTSGSVVASTDAAGRYSLRDVPEGPSLGALAVGHLPSALVDLDLVDRAASPVKVDLVVTAGGGAVEGVVTGEDGAPIEGAEVVLGRHDGTLDMRFDNTFEEGWTSRHTTTDEEGRYRLDALATGPEPLAIRKLGLPQWTGEVVVETGHTARRDVVLRPGVTVTGVVTDVDGAPVEGARVQAFEEPLSEAFLQNGQIDFDGAFAQEVALSQADGAYALTSLPRRRVFLYAMDPRKERARLSDTMRFTKIEMDLSAEDEPTWDPVLSDGRVIQGVVRYRDGTPIENIFVNLKVTDGEDPHRRATHTGTGEFKFIQLPGRAYTVSGQIWELPEGHEEPRMTHVVPGGEPIELIADFDPPVEYEEATVSVRFEDAGDRAKGGNVSVSLENLERYSWRLGDTEGDDVWTFDLDRPGRHRPIALVGERLIAVGEPFDFVPGTDLDLGTFSSGPGGTLVLEIERSEEHPPEDLRMHLRHEAYRHGERLDPGNEPVLRLESLEPGSGTITITGGNLMRREVEYTIAAGADTVLHVSLVPAVAVPYRIDLPSLEEAVSISFRFIDVADGSAVREVSVDDARRYKNPLEFRQPLEPGDYRLEVELGDGRRASTTFTVTSLDPTEAPSPRVAIE